MADILLDVLDDRLSIPIIRQGYLDMFNGINVTQIGTSRSTATPSLKKLARNTSQHGCTPFPSWKPD
jgi:hypothetical protein